MKPKKRAFRPCPACGRGDALRHVEKQVGRSQGEAVIMLYTECECGLQGIGYSATRRQMAMWNTSKANIWRAMWEDSVEMFLQNEPMGKQEEKDVKDGQPEP